MSKLNLKNYDLINSVDNLMDIYRRFIMRLSFEIIEGNEFIAYKK